MSPVRKPAIRVCRAQKKFSARKKGLQKYVGFGRSGNIVRKRLWQQIKLFRFSAANHVLWKQVAQRTKCF
jgi:hypothetical protein